jgi:hypothetical protein
MINKELYLLIQPYSKEKNIQLTENTNLNTDLSIYDEKAKLLLDAYSKKFNVNISDLDFDKYFSSSTNNNNSFSIANLEKGIGLGILDESTINWEENDQNLPPKFSVKKAVLGFILCAAIAIILCAIAYYL